MIATVRVANPAHPNHFMTINASDYRERVHGPLWHEQAHDFAGLPAAPTVSYGQSERDYAGALMLEVFAFEMEREGRNFHTLSPGDRHVFMRDKRNEFEQYRTKWHRSQQVSQGDLFGEGIVPGQTPGYPVDAVSGEPLKLSDAQRETIAGIMMPPPAADGSYTTAEGQGLMQEPGRPELVPLDESLPEPLPPLAEVPETPAQPEAPAQSQGAPAAAPSWAAQPQPAAPTPDALRVEKGPGGKWYVKRGKEVLSEGFTTKAQAEADLPNHEAK